MTEFLADPATIDFYASHEMQKQCGRSVFDELSKRHRCVWRGDRDAPTPGAAASVVLGHVSDFPQARKSRGGYAYSFFFTHDLGEMDAVYRDFYMRQFDVVFTPGRRWAENARRYLAPDQRVVVAGWPKYDAMRLGPEHADIRTRLEGLDRAKTIIYGPSYAHLGAWPKVIETLESLDATVILKNFIYFSESEIAEYRGRTGELPPEILAADAMEARAASSETGKFIVLPRTLNICSLFPYSSWLVSDTSSCLIEFAPYGTSVETAADGDIHDDFPEVAHAGIDEFAAMYKAGPRARTAIDNSIFRHPEAGAGEIAARVIDETLYSVPPDRAAEASRRRLGTLVRCELRVGERAGFALFLGKRAFRHPRLIIKWLHRRLGGMKKGPVGE